MSGGISPRYAQNPLSGEQRKTLTIAHHALSSPPSHHHLYIIHLINWLQRFYRITMSLKRPFVPKSDVKQRFTTTTTTTRYLSVLYTMQQAVKTDLASKNHEVLILHYCSLSFILETLVNVCLTLVYRVHRWPNIKQIAGTRDKAWIILF